MLLRKIRKLYGFDDDRFIKEYALLEFMANEFDNDLTFRLMNIAATVMFILMILTLALLIKMAYLSG